MDHLDLVAAALGANILSRFRDPAAARHDYVRATLREPNRDGFAEPAVGAGNQTRPSVKPDAIGHRRDLRSFASLIEQPAQDGGDRVAVGPIRHNGRTLGNSARLSTQPCNLQVFRDCRPQPDEHGARHQRVSNRDLVDVGQAQECR